MSSSNNSGPSRRQVMKTSGQIAVASALAGVAIPHVHAAENNTIQVALVGCGGRGTGAADNALATKSGPIKLVAMADVFKDRLGDSKRYLQGTFPKQVDVPEDRQFIGFDGYKKAMDCLRPGDVAIFATPLAFRWVHFSYAIEKGLNVFMEKPLTVDGPSAAQDAQVGRRVGRSQPQGRRRPDVPALCGPRRAVQADQGRPDRRHHPAAGLPYGRPDGEGGRRPPAEGRRSSWSTRSAGSTRSCGPAAAPTAIS